MQDPRTKSTAKNFATTEATHLGDYRDWAPRIVDSNWVRNIPHGDDLEAWLRNAAYRCTDCGIPTCVRAPVLATSSSQGCPLNNPHEWLNYAAKGDFEGAIKKHNQTTLLYLIYGALCYAPCEIGCIHSDDSATKGIRSKSGSVSIKDAELALGILAYERNLLIPGICKPSTGKSIAIIGSGPAGLEAAHVLSLEGHHVTVFDALDKAGGIVRYEIPAYKMPKEYLDFTIDLYRRQGIEFVLGNKITTASQAERLIQDFDAVIIATGAPSARYGLRGSNVNFKAHTDFVCGASDLLVEIELANTRGHPKSLSGQNIVIIGNKLTSADVIGKSIRAGANVTVIDTYPVDLAQQRLLSSAHEELVELIALHPDRYAIIGNSTVSSLRPLEMHCEVSVENKSDRGTKDILADRIVMAIGYEGADASVHELFGVGMDSRTHLAEACRFFGTTANPRVFCAGDNVHGATVLVNAGAAGARVARAVDCGLQGKRLDISVLASQQAIMLDGAKIPASLIF